MDDMYDMYDTYDATIEAVLEQLVGGIEASEAYHLEGEAVVFTV